MRCGSSFRPTTAGAARDTGIGLALARLILERAGGRVDVEDSPLGGARFVLTVPRSSATS
ncbi:MAG: hypothetical protein JWN27_3916 [Candidatus Eremiobacteraeota bacterium]|nr:hypothetical protein [Candidatus Eremiobacteraeota bacterium]